MAMFIFIELNRMIIKLERWSGIILMFQPKHRIYEVYTCRKIYKNLIILKFLMRFVYAKHNKNNGMEEDEWKKDVCLHRVKINQFLFVKVFFVNPLLIIFWYECVHSTFCSCICRRLVPVVFLLAHFYHRFKNGFH